LTTVLAFLVAIALLIAVHELGHYGVAVATGVKVLRFSIGFGPRVMGWTSRASGTEFVIGAFPLGGYVKMLDEREGPVSPQERHRAFNVQPLKVKTAIVSAGPAANLLFAVAMYSCVNWTGVEQAQAVLGKPVAGSVAQQAGLSGGERVLRAGFQGEALEEVASFEQLRWLLTRAALAHRNVELEFATGPVSNEVASQLAVLHLEDIDASNADAQMFRSIGILAPFSEARLAGLLEDGAALKAGLREADLVLQVDGTKVVDSAQLRELIRLSGQSGTVKPQAWLVNRAGEQRTIMVTPKLESEGAVSVGRVGALIGAPPALVNIRYGLWQGLGMALQRTWEVSALTVKMMGKIATGQASLKNLSGPLTIADYAGKSAAMGVTQFVVFLALISISLGVLNLLPIPVLDGGHLMYYLWESLTGRPVSEKWMEHLQRAGLVVLTAMMLVAVFNDLARFWG
jgi:regulator of sigma E protease